MTGEPAAKIALVTPWPPQRSGIADYAFGLRNGLASLGFEVDVFTNAESADEGVTTIRSVGETVAKLADYDHVLMQLGNHPHFHGYMIPLMSGLGRRCTVELHDVLLDHILPGLNWNGDAQFETRWLKSNYSQQPGRVSPAFPVSDLLTRHAASTIVHSNFAKSWLDKLSARNVAVVDLGYPMDSSRFPPKARGGVLDIGVFGTFQKSRQIPVLIAALSVLRKRGVGGWRLNLVGRRCEGFEGLLDCIRDHDMIECVTIIEDLPQQEFLQKMGSMDVHVALRSPTMGETSGVVVQGLTMGVPTIVSDVGWYSELPKCVGKVSEAAMLFDLTLLLGRLIANDTYRDEIRGKTYKYASHAHDVRRRAEEIAELVINEKGRQ